MARVGSAIAAISRSRSVLCEMAVAHDEHEKIAGTFTRTDSQIAAPHDVFSHGALHSLQVCQ